MDKNDDFKINLLPPDTEPGKGGATKAANRATFPAIVGTSASMTVGRVEGCGINTFHVHPRSAELQLLMNGTLTTEMVPENGVVDKDGKARVIRQELKPFDMTVFYQGSVHHQFNPNCDPAYFVASFAAEDPGTTQVENSVYLMDKNAIFPVLAEKVNFDTIEQIKKNIPPSLVKGFFECKARCYGDDSQGGEYKKDNDDDKKDDKKGYQKDGKKDDKKDDNKNEPDNKSEDDEKNN